MDCTAVTDDIEDMDSDDIPDYPSMGQDDGDAI